LYELFCRLKETSWYEKYYETWLSILLQLATLTVNDLENTSLSVSANKTLLKMVQQRFKILQFNFFSFTLAIAFY
jgi:hypothetical protein